MLELKPKRVKEEGKRKKEKEVGNRIWRINLSNNFKIIINYY